jgi:hypothetical protein
MTRLHWVYRFYREVFNLVSRPRRLRRFSARRFSAPALEGDHSARASSKDESMSCHVVNTNEIFQWSNAPLAPPCLHAFPLTLQTSQTNQFVEANRGLQG